jgi:tRNA G18 (ribose-2'-O)-methylase SpoU
MEIHDISSRSNPAFRNFLKLLAGQGVKRERLSLLSGYKQVKETLLEFPDRCEALLFMRGQSLPPSEEIRQYRLAADLFREIDVYGTRQPILLVRVEPLFAWNSAEWPPGCTLFIPFQDPSNVGAVIRSAAAFGVAQSVVLKEGAHPFHHKSIKVAGSAIFRVPIFTGPSIRDLGGKPFPIITLSPEGQDIGKYAFPPSFGLLPGLEGPGLPLNVRDFVCLSIPMSGGVESLNAALATGIALYVWRSRSRKE